MEWIIKDMDINKKLKDDIDDVILKRFPNEAVLVIADDEIIELKNTHDTPTESFSVNITEYRKAVKGKKNILLIHSHCYDMNSTSDNDVLIKQLGIDRRQPSHQDMVLSQKLPKKVVHGIVACEGDSVSDILVYAEQSKPSPDYIGREYYNSCDEWQLVCDYLKSEFKIVLESPPREFAWWNQENSETINLYDLLNDHEHLKEIDLRDIEHNDIICMSIDADEINHIGVFIDDDKNHSSLLHHQFLQLSTHANYLRYKQYAKKAYRVVQ